MATVTQLGAATFNTNAGNKTVTATPAVGDLIVIAAAFSATTRSAAEPSTVTDNQSGTYTRVILDTGTDAPSTAFFIRDSLVSSAVSTIYTATSTGTNSGGGLVVYKVTGMLRAGSSAAKQIKGGFVAAAGTPALTFTNAVNTNNPVVTTLTNNTSPATVTPPSGWTETPTPDLGYSTPTVGMETSLRNSGFTGTTVTWGSTSATIAKFAAVELDTSALLVIGDGAHAHTADNIVLVPNLIIQDAVHDHAADNVVLTAHDPAGGATLVIADGVHAHTADNIVLVPNLIIQDGVHSHTADNVVLVPNLIIQDGTHAHTADNIVLVPNLIIQDGTHGHTADNVVLTPHEPGAASLIIQDGLHSHLADSIVLTQHYALVIQDGLHDHSSDNVELVLPQEDNPSTTFSASLSGSTWWHPR